MSSLFGISIALKGILASQASLETVAHNVANANAEGYSRQTGSLSATDPINLPDISARVGRGVIGTGVGAAAVRRNRDTFLDLQFREAVRRLGQFETTRDTLRQVETVFGEPSEFAISGLTQDFFDSLQDLSGLSEDDSARTSVAELGRTFAFGVQRVYEELVRMQADLNKRAVGSVIEINDIATQIAALNGQIARGSAAKTPANDLLDRRDLLLDQLTKIVGINVSISNVGEADVRVEGMLIVAGDKTYQLTTSVNPATGFDRVVYQPFNQVITPTGGSLAGLIDARDVKLGSVAASTGILNRLNLFASNFISEFNKLHRGGFGLEIVGADNVSNVTTALGATGVYSITSNGAGTLTATFTPTGGGATTAVTGAITAGGTNSTLIPGITLTGAAAFTGTATTITVGSGLVVSAGGDVASAANVNGSYRLTTNSGASTVAIAFIPVGGTASPSVTKSFTAGASNSNLIVGLTIDFKAGGSLVNGGLDYITTGNNFFTGVAQTGGVGARDIGVHSSFDLGVDQLAASSRFREEGNGQQALSLSVVGQSALTALGNASLTEYYRSTLSSLGADTRQASSFADNQENLVTLVKATRETISGVSIDEETADLLRFELGFQGSARVLTTIDELLELIVNRLGTVGR